MDLIKAVKTKVPSLSAVADSELESLIKNAKSSTVAVRTALKLSVIAIAGILYLVAKTYLLNQGYSSLASIIGSFFIIVLGLLVVEFIDERIVLTNIKKTL